MRTFLLAVSVVSSVSLAGLEEDRQSASTQLAESLKRTNEACGTTFEATYDFKSEPAAKPSYQGPYYCESVVKGLGSACTNAVAKPIIVANIKSVKCHFVEGASKNPKLDASGGPVLSVAGGVLDASFDWASSNLDAETNRWLYEKWLTDDQNGPNTLQAKDELARGRADLAAALVSMNEACKSKVEATYDFASEKGNAPSPAWQGYMYCKNVLEGVTRACGLMTKHGVAKVKKLECAYERGVSTRKELQPWGGPTRKLTKEVLRFTYDWPTANVQDQVSEWVTRTLK